MWMVQIWKDILDGTCYYMLWSFLLPLKYKLISCTPINIPSKTIFFAIQKPYQWTPWHSSMNPILQLEIEQYYHPNRVSSSRPGLLPHWDLRIAARRHCWMFVLCLKKGTGKALAEPWKPNLMCRLQYCPENQRKQILMVKNIVGSRFCWRPPKWGACSFFGQNMTKPSGDGPLA